MSVRLMAQVFDLKLPPTDKLVLLALADHADHEGGRIYPSVELLARKASVDRRTVQRVLRRAETAGMLILVADAENHRPREYRLDCSQADLFRGDITPPRHTAAPAMSASDQRSGAAMDASRGGIVPPESKENRQKKENRQRARVTDEAFTTFYNAYPNKQKKPDAEKAWRQVQPDSIAVMRGLERWKVSRQWTKNEGEFVPYPATFLRARQWENTPPGEGVHAAESRYARLA